MLPRKSLENMHNGHEAEMNISLDKLSTKHKRHTLAREVFRIKIKNLFQYIKNINSIDHQYRFKNGLSLISRLMKIVIKRLYILLSAIFKFKFKLKAYNAFEDCTEKRYDRDGQKVRSELWKPDKNTWPLFDRIDFASKLNRFNTYRDNHSSGLNPAETSRLCINISPENFTCKTLSDAIAELPDWGGDIVLPSGCINLDKELILKSGVHLSGSFNSTELIFDNSEYGIVIKGEKADLISNVCVENLKISHRGNHNFCAAVFLTHSTNTYFENIKIIAPRAVGFLFSDEVYGTRVVKCAVFRAGLVGFMMIRNVKDTVLDSCTAQECEQSGVFLTDMKLPLNIDPLDFDAQIHHTSEVIGNFGPFDPKDPSPYNTTFMNCFFCGNRKMGITTDGVGCLRVINCIISDNDCEGITIDNGSWNCVIQNSHIYCNGWRGLQQDVELNVDFVDEMGMMNDGGSKAKLPGISFDNAAFSRVENNTIQGNWGDGIKLVRANYGITISGNMVIDNNRGENDRFHYFGVLVGVAQRQHPDQSDFPSCYNIVENNDILGGHYAGVHLQHGTVGNIIKDNHIRGYNFASIENHTLSEKNTIFI